MNTSVLLLVLAMVCDLVVIGIFSYDYKKTKDKIDILFILSLFFAFVACFYYLLQKLEIVIVIP
ncbi:MAG: hypothetical protein KAV48_00135 [Methanomicrobia archaeon]|nr:hypothetical protein [Methanomicrobia archaeon]MCK4432319.1 hypothetical protein [Methanomicrobia archaeon]MCK4636595.1 hypothetical protein [Methanomicrobia archaeon]